VTSPKVRLWYALLVSFLACLVVALASVGYASYVQRQNDRRWCSLLSDLDSAYQSPPRPTTPTGVKVAAEIHRLRIGFGCPER
jgi:hypothetical protein